MQIKLTPNTPLRYGTISIKYMKKISFYLVVVVIIGIALISLWSYQKYFKGEEVELLLFSVERGSMQEIVKVRGEVVSQTDFDLGFPFSGIIENIFVQEGQEVKSGDPLMKLEITDFELERGKLQAQLDGAKADLALQEADLKRAQIESTNTQTNLAKVIEEQDTLVKNAFRTLLSSNLEALPVDKGNDDIAPLVSGTYSCDTEGSYTLSTYSSAANSGYSYRLSGLETGTYTAYTESPAPFGTCGLSLQFVDGEAYRNRDWTIAIPNTRSAAYIGNLNAYEEAIKVRDLAVEKARALLEERLKNAGLESERDEAVTSMEQMTAQDARVEKAKATIRNYQAQIATVLEKIKKSTLYAPADAAVAKLWFEKGEFFSPNQIGVSLSTSGHKIQADISELEIGKINEVDGSKVLIQLDAFPDVKFTGNIVSIEPREIVKEGDKYYRTNVYVEPHGSEIRAGMNADLMILTSSKDDVLKIPEFVVYKKDDKEFVTVLVGDLQEEVEIETGISDGEFIEVESGLREGQTVVFSAD